MIDVGERLYIHCEEATQKQEQIDALARGQAASKDCVACTSWMRQLIMQEQVDTVAKPNKEKKKKNAQLVLRLNKDLRDQFVDACQDLDTSAAREVRRFIKKFLKSYENGEFDD